MRKETLLSDFKLQLARDVGHEEAGVRRLWFYDTLPNKSRRPSTPVPPDHDSRRLADVGPLTSTPHTRRSTSLDLWLGANATGTFHSLPIPPCPPKLPLPPEDIFTEKSGICLRPRLAIQRCNTFLMGGE